MDLFDQAETFSLPNGVRCIAMQRAGYSIELEVFIATGSMHEGSLLGSGMSHFLEHMLFQGCAGFPRRSAAEKIQRYGGDINAYTTFERTVVTARVAPEKFAEAVQILGAMVRSTEVAPARFNEERQVILRECNRHADRPQSRLFDAAYALSFDRHPARVPVIGYPELVETLTQKELLAYHAERYAPQRCVVVAVGNVDRKLFHDAVESAFGDWRRHALAEPVFPAIPTAGGKRDTFFFSDPQERLLWGMPMPGIADFRAPAADLLFGMLGGAESSFLPVQLELSSQLAQNVRTFYHTIDRFGYAGLCAAATPEKFDAMRSALCREVENFRRKGLTASALKREKQRQTGDELAAVNDFSYLAGMLGVSQLACGRADFADCYRHRRDAVTLDEVKMAADELLAPGAFDEVIQRNAPAVSRRRAAKKAGALPVVRRYSALSCVNIAKPESPMDYATLILPGGALFETPNERGVGKLWSQLLLCGGNGIGETELLEKLDALGAAVNVNAGMNSLAVEVNAPRKNFYRALEIVGKVIASPSFDERQFQREKERLIETIALQKSAPLGAAMCRARQLLFGDHPYSGATDEEKINALTRENGLRFWRRRFVKSRTVAGFSGAVDADRALALFLGGIAWQKGKISAAPEIVFPNKNCRENIALEREQLAVVRILPGVRLGDGRTGLIFSLLQQNENGLFSRLFQDVREKESLVYSVGMRADGGFQRGAFAFTGLTRPDQGEKLAALLDREVKRLGRSGISQAEFDLDVERQTFENGTLTEHPELELASIALDLYYGRVPLTPQAENDFLRALSRGEFNRELRAAFADVPKIEVFAGAMP